MSLYKDLLAMGQTVIDDLQRPFKVKEEQKNLEMKILKLESQIAKDELTVEQQKSANPVDWDKLINALDSKELNERKLKQLQKLEKEMFIGEGKA